MKFSTRHKSSFIWTVRIWLCYAKFHASVYFRIPNSDSNSRLGILTNPSLNFNFSIISNPSAIKTFTFF